MNNHKVRGPEEISALFQEIKQKKKEKGQKYTTVDFLKDVGLSGNRSVYSHITADPDSNGHRNISKAVDMLMDNLEEKWC